MTDRPTTTIDDEPMLASEPRGLRSYDLGVLAGLGTALAYGISAELLGLSWGLLAVAFVGGMVIGGVAADDMWGALTKAPVRPADPNLENLSAGEISRDMCEGRIGKAYICIKLPEWDQQGVLKRDAAGKVLYIHQCDFNFKNVTTGEI